MCVCVWICLSACEYVCACRVCEYVCACRGAGAAYVRAALCGSQNHKSFSPPSPSPSSNYTSAPLLLKTNNPVTLAIISPNPYAISHLTEIIREMCNYQKTIIILEGNVTSNCKILISKILFQKGLGPTKIKIKKFITNHRRPADCYVWCYFISMRVFFYGTKLYHPATFLTWIIKKHRFL